MRESFVLHSEYIEDLPEEYKSVFLMYVYNYGIKGIVPELEGLEKALWLKIQRRIDADIDQWEETKSKRSEAGKKHSGNQYTQNSQKMEQNGTKWNSVPSVPNEWNTMEQNGTNGTVSVFDNVYVSDNECVSVSDNVGAKAPDTSTPSATEYAKEIYKIFEDAGLPCAHNNIVSFMQTDFKNGLDYIHKTSTFKGFSSADIIKACKNYADILERSDTFEGYRQKLSFYKLVQKNWFYELMTDSLEYFKQHKADYGGGLSATSDTYKDLCPECGKKQVDWIEDRQLFVCAHCGKTFDWRVFCGNSSSINESTG